MPVTIKITLYEPDTFLNGRISHLFWTLYMATYPRKWQFSYPPQ